MNNVLQLPARIARPTRQEVFDAIAEANGNVTRAAKALNLKRTTLLYYVKIYGLRRDAKLAESVVPADTVLTMPNGDFECAIHIKKVGNKLLLRTVLQ